MDESRRLQYLSYGLYRKVNHIVGPERVIQIRRTVANLQSDFNALHSTLTDDPTYQHLSGSYAEGFRFRSSDKDIMIVYRHVIVTNNREKYDNYNDNITLLVMETDQCRPGSCLLKLQYIPRSRDDTVTLVTRSCVQLPQGVYVSSSLWKEVTPKMIPNGELHGPCDSGIVGINEVDFAFCFKCLTWPESAVACINRLKRVEWPTATVLYNILKEGCHMVAIGAKGSYYEDTEWRISFSSAEKTLIHQMNHSQFLCYGLLKIFLKEAIEKRGTEEKLICSYFLKTAVFWEICNERTQWSSTTFLQCFWACFRRLIGWVYNGYCPNFFIPENNMFYGKIHGHAQLELLSHLTALYSEGYKCLLRCASLQPLLGNIVNQPLVTLSLQSENELYSNSYYAIRTILEIMELQPREYTTLRTTQISLQKLSLLTEKNNELKCISLSTWDRAATQLLIVRSSLQENSAQNSENKEMHFNMHSVLHNLKRQPFDLLHHNILSCLYLYRRGFYRIAVKVLLHAKRKLQQPNVIYHWRLSEYKYRVAGGEHSPLTAMMKKVLVCAVGVPMDICVPELTMDHQASTTTDNVIPFQPFELANFLLYLSYYHLQQFDEADAVVKEFTTLLAVDGGQHIFPVFRAISWTMLGICQEMSGELNNAFRSYTEALHDRYSYCKVSTRVRIENVAMKMNSDQQ